MNLADLFVSREGISQRALFLPGRMRQAIKRGGRKLRNGLAVLTLAVVIAPSADAAIYTRFDSDSYLTDWGVVHNGTPSNPAAIVTGPDSSKALRMTRPSSGGSAGDSAFVYYKGSAEGVTNGLIADFEMTSTVSFGWTGVPPNSTGFGFLVRGQSTAYNGNKGYYIAFTGIDGGKLVIVDSPLSHTVSASDPSKYGPIVASSEAMSLSIGVNYVFKISAIGTTISASIWSEDGNTLLGSVGLSDPGLRTNAGYFGIRSAFGNSGVTQYVKDISIEVIPEPATIALGVIGGAAMLTTLRRRKSVGG